MQAWMNAREAATRLNVRAQTLYAYVSRGLLESEAVSGSRNKRYRRSDVERLLRQQGTTRNPRSAARASLNWHGMPVLKSSLTLIKDGNLYYRGQDAVALAEYSTLEELAGSLWGCDAATLLKPGLAEPGAMALRALGGANGSSRTLHTQHCLNAFQVVVGQQGEQLQTLDSSIARGAQLLRWMRASTTLRACPAKFARRPMHEQLQRIWGLETQAADLLRRALVLCADHELNVSSFTARCVASSGASMAACVTAGLAALSGARHGGATAAIEEAWPGWMSLPARTPTEHRQFFDSVVAAANTTAAISFTPIGLGFGHPLYPNGDPRARSLLAHLPTDVVRDRFVEAVFEATGLRPSVDFALVAVRRQLGLPAGAAFALFAIGRVVGWIAHILEQRKYGSLIRPRAEYLGPLPESHKVIDERAKSQGRVVSFG